MSDDDTDRTASLMSPAKLAQLRARPVAATPAAMLNQMAADAGSLHARRLVELGKLLEDQVRDRDYSALCSALQTLDSACSRLDFSLLQPRGWFARATGKGKAAVSEFLAQYDQIASAADDVKAHAQALVKNHAAQASASDRSLTEFEVELRAIEKVMDQGTRWLQDMRNQLKAREADAVNDASAQQQIAQDASRCDLLLNRLKQLRVAATAAGQMQQQLKAMSMERTRAVQSLRQALEGDLKTWRSALDALAARAEDIESDALAEPSQSHERLQTRIKDLHRQLVQLQTGEGALAEELGLLADPLRAVS